MTKIPLKKEMTLFATASCKIIFLSICACFFNNSCSPYLYPDPCLLVDTSLNEPLEIGLSEYSGTRIIIDNATQSQLPANAHVALIVNGNGYGFNEYRNLGRFLSNNGFIVVIAIRQNISSSVEDFVINILRATFDQLNLNSNTPVALIGHSIGGGIVMQTAIYNNTLTNKFNIKSVVGIAPALSNYNGNLSGIHTSSLLLIYGSQDEDVEGDQPLPIEAFAAYDLSGSENSTTCPGDNENCLILQSTFFDKTMIYVYGAGHASLITNISPICLDCDPDSYYLTRTDQFCITKGYINAFLRWKLRNENIFKNIVRGRVIPPSISSIVTSLPDHKGNPVGSPLLLSFQISPEKKRVIENFEDGNFDLSQKSPDVQLYVANENEYTASPKYVRHQTKYLFLAWPDRNQTQFVRFNIPENSRSTQFFSHFSVRIGQLKTSTEDPFSHLATPYENPHNGNQSIEVCLRDNNNNTRCVQIPNIPPVDRQPDGVAHSAMKTISISLNRFQGINRADIRNVIFNLPSNSKGTLIVDNIEWFRD